MCAQKITEPRARTRSLASRIEGPLTWLGGGHHADEAAAGAVVSLGAVLAGLVAGLAASEATRWSPLAIVPLALVFGLLVGAVTRGTAGGSDRGRPGIVGRAAVAVALGIAVGELAALVIFSSSIDHRLDQRALRGAGSAPAVAQASESLRHARDARNGLDQAVEQARAHQDQALVVARCEYNPTPPCPQTRITGVPGPGPETRTANELLADAQHELDNALAARDRQAPALDAGISRQEQALDRARQSAVADAGRGLGTRWVAMNELTSAGVAALALRLVTIAFFALLYLLPLILRRWRGETSHDRRTTAHADRERADLEADTAIAIKRAQVRRDAEIMWAEHQLTQARLAIEAQTEIDRERQRRRVLEALEAPVRTPSRRAFERGAEEDVYLPIAAEAEAASRAIAPVPAAETAPKHPANLPAHVEPPAEVEPHDERAAPLIPSIPDATRAAARWIRPLVPPLVARVIDNTTQPLRTARQAFEGVIEEVEEIRFSLKRTHRVTVNSARTDISGHAPHQPATDETPIASSREERGHATVHPVGHHRHRSSARAVAGKDIAGPSLGAAERDRNPELTKRDGPPELRGPDGPRQLPPGQ